MQDFEELTAIPINKTSSLLENSIVKQINELQIVTNINLTINYLTIDTTVKDANTIKHYP